MCCVCVLTQAVVSRLQLAFLPEDPSLYRPGSRHMLLPALVPALEYEYYVSCLPFHPPPSTCLPSSGLTCMHRPGQAGHSLAILVPPCWMERLPLQCPLASPRPCRAARPPTVPWALLACRWM